MYVDVPQNGHPGQWFRRPNSLRQFLRIQILCLNGVWDVVWAPVFLCTSQWRHNERDSVLNHQPHHCLLKSLFGRRSKKTSKLRVTGLCAGNSPGTGEFPAQMDSDAENVSIWWHHHDKLRCYCSWLCTSGGTNHRSMAVITLRPRWNWRYFNCFCEELIIAKCRMLIVYKCISFSICVTCKLSENCTCLYDCSYIFGIRSS